jgi:hypothetical protein
MDPLELVPYIKAQPFRPFVISLYDGREYEIRHPEVIKPTNAPCWYFSPWTQKTASLIAGR